MKIATWILRLYWLTVIVIFAVAGWLTDLHTFTDSFSLACIVAITTLPITIYSLLLIIPNLQWPWYGNIFMVLVIFGLYLGSGYFAVKKFDRMLSVAIKPTIRQRYQILSLNKVMAGRAGFTHTNIRLSYHQKLFVFEGSRSSYFLLQNKRFITIDMGKTLLGEYFGNFADVSARERWQALKLYWEDWVKRYVWLGVIFIIILLWSPVKHKLFK